MTSEYEEKFEKLKQAFRKDEVMLFVAACAGQDVALLCIREQSVDGFVPIAAIFPERRQTLIVRLSPDGELNLEDRTEQHPEWN